MKKLISIFLALIILLSGSSILASEIQETKDLHGSHVLFQGQQIEEEILLETTREWLNWYQSLSLEEQLAISYIPPEISKQLKASEKNNLTSPTLYALGPPVYNPSYWNDPSRIKRANCYAYAMDVICASEMKLQPGQTAGQQFKYLTKESIIEAVKADGPYLGKGRSIYETTSSASPGTNYSTWCGYFMVTRQ